MDRPIRLMTANLFSGRADVVHLDGILRQFDPDLLLIQELGENAADLIADRFDSPRSSGPISRPRAAGSPAGWPGTFRELPLPWRPGLWARLDLGLQVANIHVRNAVAFPWWKSAKYRGTAAGFLVRVGRGQSDPSASLRARRGHERFARLAGISESRRAVGRSRGSLGRGVGQQADADLGVATRVAEDAANRPCFRTRASASSRHRWLRCAAPIMPPSSSISYSTDPEPFRSLRTCDLNRLGRPTYGLADSASGNLPVGVGTSRGGLFRYARPESQIAAESLSSSHHGFGSHVGLRTSGV